MNFSHRKLCHISGNYLNQTNVYDIVAIEVGIETGIADVLAISSKYKNINNPRITVAEIKRTRSDLLQDLNKQKLRKYEKNCTHLYLCATQEALLLAKNGFKECAVELEAKGLPSYWGIILLPSDRSSYFKPTCLRPAKQLNKYNAEIANVLTYTIAKSLSNKML